MIALSIVSYQNVNLTRMYSSSFLDFSFKNHAARKSQLCAIDLEKMKFVNASNSKMVIASAQFSANACSVASFGVSSTQVLHAAQRLASDN